MLITPADEVMMMMIRSPDNQGGIMDVISIFRYLQRQNMAHISYIHIMVVLLSL